MMSRLVRLRSAVTSTHHHQQQQQLLHSTSKTVIKTEYIKSNSKLIINTSPIKKKIKLDIISHWHDHYELSYYSSTNNNNNNIFDVTLVEDKDKNELLINLIKVKKTILPTISSKLLEPSTVVIASNNGISSNDDKILSAVSSADASCSSGRSSSSSSSSSSDNTIGSCCSDNTSSEMIDTDTTKVTLLVPEYVDVKITANIIDLQLKNKVKNIIIIIINYVYFFVYCV